MPAASAAAYTIARPAAFSARSIAASLVPVLDAPQVLGVEDGGHAIAEHESRTKSQSDGTTSGSRRRGGAVGVVPGVIACEFCAYAQEHGWWGKSDITHCSDCHDAWGGLRMAHCPVAGGCHRTFSTDRSASLGHPGDRCVSDDELGQLGLIQVAHAHGVLWRWEKRRETP